MERWFIYLGGADDISPKNMNLKHLGGTACKKKYDSVSVFVEKDRRNSKETGKCCNTFCLNVLSWNFILILGEFINILLHDVIFLQVKELRLLPT